MRKTRGEVMSKQPREGLSIMCVGLWDIVSSLFVIGGKFSHPFRNVSFSPGHKSQSGRKGAPWCCLPEETKHKRSHLSLRCELEKVTTSRLEPRSVRLCVLCFLSPAHISPAICLEMQRQHRRCTTPHRLPKESHTVSASAGMFHDYTVLLPLNREESRSDREDGRSWEDRQRRRSTVITSK